MALFARVGARAHFMRGGSARDEWDQEPWLMLDWSDDDDAAAAADDVAAAAAAAELSSRMISFGEEGEGEAAHCRVGGASARGPRCKKAAL